MSKELTAERCADLREALELLLAAGVRERRWGHIQRVDYSEVEECLRALGTIGSLREKLNTEQRTVGGMIGIVTNPGGLYEQNEALRERVEVLEAIIRAASRGLNADGEDPVYIYELLENAVKEFERKAVLDAASAGEEASVRVGPSVRTGPLSDASAKRLVELQKAVDVKPDRNVQFIEEAADGQDRTSDGD